MGNCIFGRLNNMSSNVTSENMQLLPNISVMHKICKKEICALCENNSTTLKTIENVDINSISTIAFCQDCRIKLGY